MEEDEYDSDDDVHYLTKKHWLTFLVNQWPNVQCPFASEVLHQSVTDHSVLPSDGARYLLGDWIAIQFVHKIAVVILYQ